MEFNDPRHRLGYCALHRVREAVREASRMRDSPPEIVLFQDLGPAVTAAAAAAPLGKLVAMLATGRHYTAQVLDDGGTRVVFRRDAKAELVVAAQHARMLPPAGLNVPLLVKEVLRRWKASGELSREEFAAVLRGCEELREPVVSTSDKVGTLAESGGENGHTARRKEAAFDHRLSD